MKTINETKKIGIVLTPARHFLSLFQLKKKNGISNVYVQASYLLAQNEKRKYVHLISNELNLITQMIETRQGKEK